MHGLGQAGGRVDKGVAVHAAKSGEFDVFQSGYGAEDALLFRVGQFGLEADQVVKVGVFVILTQLNDGKGVAPGSRVTQTDRLHGTKGQSHLAAFGKNFHRHAAFEVDHLFKVMRNDLVAFTEGFDEGEVLLFVKGAIEVVCAATIVA